MQWLLQKILKTRLAHRRFYCVRSAEVAALRFIIGILINFASAKSSQLSAANTPAMAGSSLSNSVAPFIVQNVKLDDIVHGLVNLEFSDHHLTSRGINLQDKGLILQQYVRLDWELYKSNITTGKFINEITLTTAVWNDIDTRRSGVEPGRWNEIDPTIGPSMRFWNDWTLESPFTAFISETSSFPTCWAWNPRLTYHDHFIKNFSINPYIEFFDEIQNKITVVLVRSESERSYYGVVGMNPTYVFQNMHLRLELPTYVIIPGSNFYQRKDGNGGGTDLGLFATMFKATVPLDFIRPSFGKWSIYAGIQYDYLNNPGLLDGNEIAGADHSRERNILVFHGGFNLRF